MNWKIDFLRSRRESRELSEEIEAHLEEKIAHLVDAGVPPREARARARREFGNATLYREAAREAWGWVWLETLLQDARYGARMLLKNPGFSAVAVLTLALGIAVDASIFSLVSGWVLKKPPVADPDRVLSVVSTNPARAIERGNVSAADYLAWRDANRSFTGLAAMLPDENLSLSGDGDPERLGGMRVTANYFTALGVTPYLGRTFAEGEDQAGRNRVVLLSYGLWQRRFAGDRNIAGKTILLDGEKHVVIGVMPGSFQLLNFVPGLWTPLVLSKQTPSNARDDRSLVLTGRLKPGATMAQARADMEGLARRAEEGWPGSEKGWGADVMTLQEYSIEEFQVRPTLEVLMTAVGLVLLIACANIANLLLARAASRQQEIAIRTALGAHRLRVVRQLLVESLMIAGAGGAAGLTGAWWGIHALRSAMNFNPGIASIAGNITLDGTVAAFTCLASMAAALVFGLAPAIRVSAADPHNTLRQSGRSGHLRRGWGRNILVGGQIALAMVLVTGAGLMIKATGEELNGDFGFDPKHVLAAPISLTSSRYKEPARRAAFLESVLAKVGATPGVDAAAVASTVPMNAGSRTFSIQGQAVVPEPRRPRAQYTAASPGELAVLNMPVIQGRAFRDTDGAGGHRVAIVNRAFAERFLPGESALGRYIRVDRESPDWSEIVGVCANIKTTYRNTREDDAQIYEPFLQAPLFPQMWVVLRTSGDPSVLARGLRGAVWSVDPEQPIGKVQTIASMIGEVGGGEYIFDSLLTIFGAMALLIAAVGIYGVVAYAVAQRTHEIGIRIALGASRCGVLLPVIGQGMLLALGSAALGLLAAAPLPKFFEALLQGFHVHGMVVFLSVPLLLLLVVLAAIYVPAARAVRVDPMEALRYE